MKVTTLAFVIGLLSSAAYAATTEAPAVSGAATPKASASASAQGNPASAVTATCRDGTAFSGTSKSGACSGHKGVKSWAETGATPAGQTDAKSDSKTAAQKSSAPLATAAAGGGLGKVWLNAKSKTYHCQSDRYYGRTKEGAYMTEAEAKAKGAHADHGKACG